MAKKASNTSKETSDQLGVALTSQFPSAYDALAVLKKELADLKGITESAYKCQGNGLIPGFQKTIQEETDVRKLVEMWSSVSGRKKAYDTAQQELGFETVPNFTVNGAEPEAIKQDIKLREAVLKFSQRKSELEALIKEGESFLTEKDKYQEYLKRLMSTVKPA